MPVTISHILYYFLLCLLCIPARNPDYCDFDNGQTCIKGTDDVDKGAHPACECSLQEGRTEVFGDRLQQFRKDILDIHNKLRNDFAGGSEASKGFNYASDMMAMSYSTTLEDIARCRAMGSLFVKSQVGHEPCKWMRGATNQNPIYHGQNLYGGTAKISTKKDLENAINNWYSECDEVDDKSLMDSYGSSGKIIGHFTQLVWSRTTLVGCVLVHMPDSQLKVYQYTLLCNYHGVIDIGASGNMMGEPVYKRVESKNQICSECYAGTKCYPQSTYPNLCTGEGNQDDDSGKIIPGNDPSDHENSHDNKDGNKEEDDADSADSPFLKSKGCTGNIARKILICAMIFFIMVVFY